MQAVVFRALRARDEACFRAGFHAAIDDIENFYGWGPTTHEQREHQVGHTVAQWVKRGAPR